MKKVLNAIISGVFTVALVLLVTACAGNKEVVQKDNIETDKIKVVTTIFPQYDFARAIGGDKLDLRMLVQPGSEVHGFEPTLTDINDIEKSDLFIYVGGEGEEWAKHLIDTAKIDTSKTISLLDAVDTVEEEVVEGMENSEHEEEGTEGEEAPETDEHVWTSPKNAIKIVNCICNKLCEIDSQNSDYYRKNADSYLEKLKKIDADLTEVTDKATNKTLIFAERFPFRYLAKDYNLEYYAAFKGCSSSTEPSLATISFLADKVKTTNSSTVFYIEFSDGKVADTICNMTGAKKAMLHSCHNLSPEDFEAGVTYLDLMEKNVEVLREALK